MQICLLRKRFVANVAFVGSFTGMALLVFPPAAVLCERLQAYIAFIQFVRGIFAGTRRVVIDVPMCNH